MIDVTSGLPFLNGGGEAGKCMRELDWSKADLGLPVTWPACLRTSVSNMLRTDFPVMLFWGEKYSCLCNDAFLSRVGDAASFLGRPAGDTWLDAWSTSRAQLRTVLTSGRPYTVRDKPLTTVVDGAKKTTYWTFSYSQVANDDGSPGGVMLTCMEATYRASAPPEATPDLTAEDSPARVPLRVYETVVSATPDLVYVFDLNYTFAYANRALLTMWGKSWGNAIGKGLRENGYEEWHAAMHEREIDHVAATGESVRGEVSFPHAVLGRRVYDYILVPVFNEKGEVEAVAGTTRDVSDMKQIELSLRESEARFRTLVKTAPVAMAVFRGESYVAEIANDAYLALVGKNEADFLDRPLFESLPLVRPEIETILHDVVTTGRSYVGNEFKVLLPRDGKDEVCYVNFTYSPLLGSGESPEGFMVVVNDVTEQVNARHKIQENELALARAIALAELGTWSYDAATGEVTLSAKHAAMYGLGEFHNSLDDYFSLIAEQDCDDVKAKFKAATVHEANGRYDAEYRVVNRVTRKTHVIHAVGQAYFDTTGRLTRVEGTTQDVTAQREVQLALENEVHDRTIELAATNEELQAANEELLSINEELSESTRRLIQSNEELSQFAYVASHDLQEPVRKISVFVEMLYRNLPQLDERSKGFLEKIDVSANRMLNLIRDVLKHSQILSNSRKYGQVNLNRLVSDVEKEFDMLIEQHDGKVIVGELPVLDAIEFQMNQLFSNLVSNAIKFAATERPLQIEITSEVVDENEKLDNPELNNRLTYYRISVKDNGIGFEQAHADQIFEIFRRLHTRAEYSGTGIGLATCKKIVQNHGGLIYASSVPGEGATFHMILPVSQG